MRYQILKKPMILCEYAHAMGNSVGNLQDYLGCDRSLSIITGRLYLGTGLIRDYGPKTKRVEIILPMEETWVGKT